MMRNASTRCILILWCFQLLFSRSFSKEYENFRYTAEKVPEHIDLDSGRSARILLAAAVGIANEADVWNGFKVASPAPAQNTSSKNPPQQEKNTPEAKPYLPRIYADTEIRRFLQTLDFIKAHPKNKGPSKKEIRMVEREKAHKLGHAAYTSWRQKDHQDQIAQAEEDAKHKAKERAKLVALKDKETQYRVKPLTYIPGSVSPDTTKLHALRLDSKVKQTFIEKMKKNQAGGMVEKILKGSCAVVGNSGHLLSTTFGAEIDSHDVVIRMNAGPTKRYEKYVGSKTHIRVMNNALAKILSDKVDRWPDYKRYMVLEKGVHLWMRATDESTQLLKESLRKQKDLRPIFNMDHDLIYAGLPFLQEYYLEQLVKFPAPRNREKNLKNRIAVLRDNRVHKLDDGTFGKRGDNLFGKPSTGLAILFALKDMCKSITAYGMGTHDLKGQPTAYKYYRTNAKYTPVGNPTAGAVGSHTHSFEVELDLMMAMGRDGVIKFCGYSPDDPEKNSRCK